MPCPFLQPLLALRWLWVVRWVLRRFRVVEICPIPLVTYNLKEEMDTSAANSSNLGLYYLKVP